MVMIKKQILIRNHVYNELENELKNLEKESSDLIKQVKKFK
jgi:predicted CopG family antitoxin